MTSTRREQQRCSSPRATSHAESCGAKPGQPWPAGSGGARATGATPPTGSYGARSRFLVIPVYRFDGPPKHMIEQHSNSSGDRRDGGGALCDVVANTVYSALDMGGGNPATGGPCIRGRGSTAGGTPTATARQFGDAWRHPGAARARQANEALKLSMELQEEAL